MGSPTLAEALSSLRNLGQPDGALGYCLFPPPPGFRPPPLDERTAEMNRVPVTNAPAAASPVLRAEKRRGASSATLRRGIVAV